MALYQITCVTKTVHLSGHRHIESIGVLGEAATLSVKEVYRRMDDEGARFCTISPSSAAVASVEKWHCCKVDTLRSAADAVHDNNLDSLESCR